MTTLLTILEGIGVLVVGLTLRLALAVLVLAALSLPVLAVYFGVQWIRLRRRGGRGVSRLSGLEWRSGLLHTRGHLWMKSMADGFRIGVDGLAQRLLPGVERVALPMAGARIRRGEPIAEIVTATGRVPIPSPISGTVASINGALQSHPRKLERDPYLGGWLLTLRPESADTGECLAGEPSRSWFKTEARRLSRLLEQELGVATADGGELLAAPETVLTKEQWERLTSAFLKAA